MKKILIKFKKGFTLIELLAVLVVLAILALIAIPIVIKVINNAREDSYKRSIEGYARATEYAITFYLSKNVYKNINDIAMADNHHNLKAGDDIIDVNTKGDQVNCNSVSFDSKGNIKLGCCSTPSSKKQMKYYSYYDNKIIKSNEDNCPYKKYEVGDYVTIGEYGYYVIAKSDNDQDYVTVLKENPLTVEELNMYGEEHINMYTTLPAGIATNIGGFGGMNYYSAIKCGYINETSDISECSTNYDKSDINYVLNKWSKEQFKNNELIEIKKYKVRLISVDDLVDNLKYKKVFDGDGLNDFYLTKTSNVPSWVYNSNYHYWTMSQYRNYDYYVHVVTSSGNVSDIGRGIFWDDYVVRPVINVLKSAITKS